MVVSTLLKNISQLGFFFPIYGKITNVPNHPPVMIDIFTSVDLKLKVIRSIDMMGSKLYKVIQKYPKCKSPDSRPFGGKLPVKSTIKD